MLRSTKSVAIKNNLAISVKLWYNKDILHKTEVTVISENIQVREWAYLAGLIDGDGSISLTEHLGSDQYHFFFLLKVSSCYQPKIERLHQIFGGETDVYEDK